MKLEVGRKLDSPMARQTVAQMDVGMDVWLNRQSQRSPDRQIDRESDIHMG